jgi:uncharacterized membrane protein
MAATRDTTNSAGILAGPHSRRHPQTVAWVRVAVSIWLLVLAGIFWSRGYHWGAALLAPAALHLWLARRLSARAQRQP